MKSTIFSSIALAATLAFLPPAIAHAGSTDLDLGSFTPTGEGRFVQVHLGDNLIRMAAKLAEQFEPEVATLLHSLHLVRVNVVGVTDVNREEIQAQLTGIRERLDTGGWDRIAAIKEGQDDIQVHSKLKSDEVIEGVVVTVLQGNSEAVMVHVAGNILPEQIAELGKALNIEPLSKIGRKIKPQ
jgi:hypothetical protein